MSIANGPKLGLLFNSNIGEYYADNFRTFLQALDQLIMGSVVNATTVVPPTSPSPGDAYLLTGGTPSGAWTGQAGNIAVWNNQVTNSGTNTQVPAWVFYTPKPGWILWNVATQTFIGYSGSAWAALGGGGANFPTNTDITSMTGIPSTTLSSAGYAYNPGSAPQEAIISANGIQFGAGSFNDASTTGAILGNQAWTGFSYTGAGIGVWNSTTATIIVPGQIGTGLINCTAVACSGRIDAAGGEIRIGTATVGTPGQIHSFATGQALAIGPLGTTTLQTGVMIYSAQSAPTSGQGLLGFDSNYATQTTVGAAGAAAALPGPPKKYFQITDTDGSIVVFPVWAHA